MAGVGTGSLQIPKRSMGRTQASGGQPGEPSAAFRDARGYLGSLSGEKGLGRRRGERAGGVCEVPISTAKGKPGSRLTRGGKREQKTKKTAPGVKSCL